MKKNEVSVAGQFTQEDVPAMLEKVTEQLETLIGSKTKDSTTKGVDLPGFGCLENIDDVQQLIKAHSSVNGKEAAFKASVKELNLKLKLKPFTISNITPAQWKKEIAIRINEVANKVQIEKLKEIKATLEANLSAKDKLAKDLAKINGDLVEMTF